LCCGPLPRRPQPPALFLIRGYTLRAPSDSLERAALAAQSRQHQRLVIHGFKAPSAKPMRREPRSSQGQTPGRRSTRALASHRSNTLLADSATRHQGAATRHGLAASQIGTPSQPAMAQPDQSPPPRKPTRRPPAHGPADRERPAKPSQLAPGNRPAGLGLALTKAACRAPGGAYMPPAKPTAARTHSGNAASPPATSASPKLRPRRFSTVNAKPPQPSGAARTRQSRSRLAPQRHPQPPKPTSRLSMAKRCITLANLLPR